MGDLKNFFVTNHGIFGNFLETQKEVLEGFEDSGVLAFSAQSEGQQPKGTQHSGQATLPCAKALAKLFKDLRAGA